MTTFLLFIIVVLLGAIILKLFHIEQALAEFIVYHGSRK